MRAVIDTNVLIAALLWRGPLHTLLEHVRAGAVSLVSSPTQDLSGPGDSWQPGRYAAPEDA